MDLNIGIGLFLYNVGYLITKNKYNILKKYSFLGGELFFISIIVLLIYQFYFNIKLDARGGIICDGFNFTILLFFGIYFIVYLSRIICNNDNFGFITKMIMFFGRHSMSIMLFHAVAFSLATYLIHKLCGMDLPFNIANSYMEVPFNIISGIVGIVVPAVVAELFSKIKKIFFDKIKNAN